MHVFDVAFPVSSAVRHFSARVLWLRILVFAWILRGCRFFFCLWGWSVSCFWWSFLVWVSWIRPILLRVCSSQHFWGIQLLMWRIGFCVWRWCLLWVLRLGRRRLRLRLLLGVGLWWVNNYDFIAVENLNIKGMVANHRLAGKILDASWGEFLRMLEYKAESACVRVVKVNLRGTSREQKHGMLDRDYNASLNILERGLSGLCCFFDKFL